jgi:TatA/E family protein of Tat protein translocase
MTLLFLESIGTTELLMILVVALIIFGPRKLPELGRSLGKGLGEFKRASDDFKQTWEREVSLESYERERKISEAMLPPEERRADVPAAEQVLAASVGAGAAEGTHDTIARGTASDEASHAAQADLNTAQTDLGTTPIDASEMPTDQDATPTDSSVTPTEPSARHDAGEVAPQPQHKTDWL